DANQSSWDEFVGAMRSTMAAHDADNGAGLAILSEANASVSVAAMRERLRGSYPQMKWFEYEPLANDNVVEGTRLAFGEARAIHYDLSHARVIVSFDADFLADGGNPARMIREFAESRKPDDDGHISRLYCFEAGLSLTGSNADERVPMLSSDVAGAVAWLAQQILGGGLDAFLDTGAAPSNLDKLSKAMTDLRAHKGGGLVIVGPDQPAEVHMLAHLINEELRNAGSTVSYAMASQPEGHVGAMQRLAAAIDAGEIRTLVMLGGNPSYNAPADLDLPAKLKSVATTIHLSDTVDETSQHCTWHVNRAHYLEAWGDARAEDGTIGIVQPLIEPLFGGRSAVEVLAALSGDDQTSGAEIVRRTFNDMTRSSDDALWQRTLRDGRLAGSGYTWSTPQVNRASLPTVASRLASWRGGLDSGGSELVFRADYKVYDGRFANNGWLQELPDPITKLTWDNAALIGTMQAERAGLANGDMVRVTVGSKSIDAPVMVVPGVVDGAVILPLGYGRRTNGRIAAGTGFDFYPLRTSTNMGSIGGATIEAIGGTHDLVTTQDHHAVEVQRSGGKGIQKRLPQLVREGTISEYNEHPEFASHRTHVTHRLSLWEETNLEDASYAWGMTIDLNGCVGCNACVVACQAENNIPIVGKDQVARGREMHWLRIDRYFKFGKTADGSFDPHAMTGVAMQPVACVHCENAPCEQVCPVAATVHDEDGLNVMIYNRCIGTRYCSNNCPYKVRRFNYFDFHRRGPLRDQPGTLLQVAPTYYTKTQAGGEPLQTLQRNPEVSVRVRGVMEKCTYCIQRIRATRIEAKNDWVNLSKDDPRRQDRRVPIDDGAIKTACQEACPAGAIEFGDLNDPGSQVRRLQNDPRAYEMLEELNVRPRTRYLAKLRNPVDQGAGHAAEGGH
ncbi:MAG: 4Fe-4S dicluster domain-containing protein, partial [Planctomycetota bacterium]